MKEGGWVARVLSLITSQDGQERETPERMLCYAASRMVGGVESAEKAGSRRCLVDRGEYIRNVLPSPTLRSLAKLYLSRPRRRRRRRRRRRSSRRRRRRRRRRCESSTCHPPPITHRLPTIAVSGLPSRAISLPNTLCLSHRPSLSPSVTRVYLSSSIQRESFHGSEALS